MTRIEALDDGADPISVRIVEGQFDYDAGEKCGREILTSTEHPSWNLHLGCRTLF